LPQRELLVAGRARQEVANLVRGARARLRLSVRQVAALSGVSASYLSELEGAQAGLPSAAVASRLDETLDLSVADVVTAARAEAVRLDEERLQAAAEPTTPTLEADPRLDDAAAALRRDPGLLDLLEQARRLDAVERRAVLALMRELTT
jgi:transcriptional regulator with XRE-family HTH domain